MKFQRNMFLKTGTFIRNWLILGLGLFSLWKLFFPKLVDQNIKCYLYDTLNQYSLKTEKRKYLAVWSFEVTEFPRPINDLDENHTPPARTFQEVYTIEARMQLGKF